jgi:hypothetical protein
VRTRRWKTCPAWRLAPPAPAPRGARRRGPLPACLDAHHEAHVRRVRPGDSRHQPQHHEARVDVARVQPAWTLAARRASTWPRVRPAWMLTTRRASTWPASGLLGRARRPIARTARRASTWPASGLPGRARRPVALTTRPAPAVGMWWGRGWRRGWRRGWPRPASRELPGSAPVNRR